ncbi:MAG: hypothetical protein HC862_10730 [Scytonema sp. RU_4_4]|nr:hypothetical protein [Scytonema sp. RU_4_4]NJR74304.1 hypothetical protein [Scytonema sp. CRU_2_7]
MKFILDVILEILVQFIHILSVIFLYDVRQITLNMSLRVERSETTQSQGFWDCFPMPNGTLRERSQ